MKKIFILIITLLSITPLSNASFGEPSSLDLYINVDKGLDSLQDKMVDFELEGGQASKGILNNINTLAKNNQTTVCLNESKKMSTASFNKIVKNENGIQINEIIKLFNENCSKDKTTTIDLVNKYSDLFTIYSQVSSIKASEKTEQIYKMSQIGLYADGNIDNSGFDLITDIEDIDKIIFADVIDYEGESIDSIDDVLNDFFEPLNEKINKLIAPAPLIKEEDKDTALPIQLSPIITTDNPEDSIDTKNTYMCVDDLNNSGLSNDELKLLLNNIENNLTGPIYNNNTGSNTYSGSIGGENDDGNDENSNGSYEKVTDNSEWPCESFFCIIIDFTTYEHSLFGGGENITIEYLLNRSNKHLSKIAATSLIPAKMGTNEFELGLKDMNLPDIFHLSFQVSTKPIPILNIEKQGKQDNSEFSVKNMLEEYYKLNGLDYKKRNDLNALVKLDANKQNINNAAGLTIEELLIKQSENDSIVRERHKKTNTLRKAIEKKVSYGVMSTFEEQFTELDKFTVGINSYVTNLDSLINQLRKIPVEY